MRAPLARAPYAAAIATLAILTGPSVAAAGSSKKKPPKLPACGGFSAPKIKTTISGDATLHRKGSPGGDLCAYLGHEDGHYEMAVNIGLVPGSGSLFKTMESSARKAATSQGATFKVVKTGSPSIFEYSQIQDASGLPACTPHEKLPLTGPPSCDGEPSWWHQNAWEYGTLKGTKKKVIVSAEIYAELGDAGINSAVVLDEAIVEGKIK